MYFKNKEDWAAWVNKSPENALSFIVSNNPRDIYDWIWKVYGAGNIPVWVRGEESRSANTERMYKFLLTRAYATGDAMQYAYSVMHAIPETKNTWIKS